MAPQATADHVPATSLWAADDDAATGAVLCISAAGNQRRRTAQAPAAVPVGEGANATNSVDGSANDDTGASRVARETVSAMRERVLSQYARPWRDSPPAVLRSAASGKMEVKSRTGTLYGTQAPREGAVQVQHTQDADVFEASGYELDKLLMEGARLSREDSTLAMEEVQGPLTESHSLSQVLADLVATSIPAGVLCCLLILNCLNWRA